MAHDKFTIDWIRGITDAEGCFNIHITVNITTTLGEQTQLRFIVDQNRIDEQMLKDIGSYFGGGTTNKYGKQSCQVVITRQHILINTIVPFFKKNPLLTSKRINFELWAQCVEIVRQKRHLTREGLDEIKEINTRLNIKSEDHIALLPKGPIDLPDDWVLGFLEGDGCLYIEVDEGSSPDSVTVQPRLEVGLHPHDR